MNIEIKKVKLSEIKLNPDNPRQISEKDMDRLVKSLQEFPEMMELREIVCDEDTVVLGGNMRTLALRKAGVKEAVAKIVTGLTPEQKREFVIKDNGSMGEWDMDLLSAWDDLPLTEWGVDLPEDWLNEGGGGGNTDPDTVPEVPKVATTKPGDIWLCGKHRVMCGDLTKAEDVERLMDGVKADMVFTDPPYNIESSGAGDGYFNKSLNKQKKDIAFIASFDPKPFLSMLPTLFTKGKINSYIFSNADLLPEYLTWAKDAKYSFNVLVWKKPSAIPINAAHKPDIEYLLLFRKSSIFNYGIENVNYSKCLEYGRENGLHPTMKPVGLIANELQISSNKGCIVVDLFGGSGSTLIAAEQTGRTAFLMELDPLYVDVIVKRFEDYTGEKGILA